MLEPEPGEFAQIGLVLIGPAGIYLVETKAREGAFLGYRDVWKRKEGNRWKYCNSPTKQNLRHQRLFSEWLKGLDLDLPGDPERYVFPIVFFTRCQWLKANECSMPVFSSGLEIAAQLRKRAREQVLLPKHIDAVAAALANAQPLCIDCGVERIEKKNKKRQ